MGERTEQDKQQELASLQQSHSQNEIARDSFVGLGHTALFAASVSFVGDVTPLSEAVFIPFLILAWLSSVVGLLSMALSFQLARKVSDARIQAINDVDVPSTTDLDKINGIALWTFPVSLILVFIFAASNVVNSNVSESKAATGLRDVRSKSGSARAEHCKSAQTEYRSSSGATSTSSDASATSSCAEGQIGQEQAEK